MFRWMLRLVLVCTLFGVTGCAQRLTADISPDVDLSKLSSFYVVHFSPDKRDLHKEISRQLSEMGFNSQFGEEEAVPESVDAVVRYEDRWQWDITNYMISLDITIRDDGSQLLASGSSFRTSLVRKSPEEMIRETLGKIFGVENVSEQASLKE